MFNLFPACSTVVQILDTSLYHFIYIISFLGHYKYKI